MVPADRNGSALERQLGGYLKLGLGVILGAFIAGGVAYATIPDGSGVIHGCYVKSGSNIGHLRVIDTGAGQACRATETPIAWNQTGPQGAVGQTGPTGPQGPSGAPLPENFRAWHFSIGTGSGDCVAAFTASQNTIITQVEDDRGGSFFYADANCATPLFFSGNRQVPITLDFNPGLPVHAGDAIYIDRVSVSGDVFFRGYVY
jgi:hypothetical protein